MSNYATLRDITSEALDQLECAAEYSGWIESLSIYAGKAAENGHEVHSKRMAGAAQYLALNCSESLRAGIDELNGLLDALAAMDHAGGDE